MKSLLTYGILFILISLLSCCSSRNKAYRYTYRKSTAKKISADSLKFRFQPKASDSLIMEEGSLEDFSDTSTKLIQITKNTVQGGKKKALVISGGGVKGSFAVGVLTEMYEKDTSHSFFKDYDIIAGTSTGSLIAPLISIGAIDLLDSLYLKQSFLDKYYKPNGTIADALRRGQSLYNTDGLRDKVKEVIDSLFDTITKPAAKTLLFSTVSLTTGELVYFTNKNLSRPLKKENRADTNSQIILRDRFRYQAIATPGLMINAIMASANQPVYADLVTIPNPTNNGIPEQYGDGGIRDYLPIQAVMDLGATEIDVIQCSPFFFNDDTTYCSILPILNRTIELVTDQVGQGNIDFSVVSLRLNASVPQSEKRIRIFSPPHSGYGDDQRERFPFRGSNLKFDASLMKSMYEMGKKITKEYLDNNVISCAYCVKEY